MLRGVGGRAVRPLLITVGALLTGALLLTTDLNLLITLGYTPLGLYKLIRGAEFGRVYLGLLKRWSTVHQTLCLLGGALWMAATVSYARRSGGACPICGRRDGPEGWRAPDRAARWGRVAAYVSMVAPVFYALTRYAWALGFPLGMSEEHFLRGQESGVWVSGLFMATFGLVGAALTLGLTQRWGEVYPRWVAGLAGRRVSIALAVVPAWLVSVLLIVGGVTVWSRLPQMVTNLSAGGTANTDLLGEVVLQVGPVLLFPVWGGSLAVAALGYAYRRRGPCRACGRGGADRSG
jgi:hypothetical protein